MSCSRTVGNGPTLRSNGTISISGPVPTPRYGLIRDTGLSHRYASRPGSFHASRSKSLRNPRNWTKPANESASRKPLLWKIAPPQRNSAVLTKSTTLRTAPTQLKIVPPKDGTASSSSDTSKTQQHYRLAGRHYFKHLLTGPLRRHEIP